MKQFVKKVLPRPMLNSLLNTRDGLRLQAEPRVRFNESNLQPLDDARLQAIWSDPQIGAAWQEDYPRIKAIYGDDDNFGGVNPGDRRAIYYLISAIKPAKTLEVGTHIGASTIHIARALKRSGNDASITTADILDVNHPETGSWKKVGMAKSPRDYAAELGCLDVITFKVGPCQSYMRDTDERFDFIFLDGDHSARAVYQEVSAALDILNPGGVILLHDYYPGGRAMYPDGATITGPYKAMERVRAENPAIGVLPLGTLPWPTKQGMSVTSLAVVTRQAA